MKSKKVKQEEAIERANGYKGDKESHPCSSCKYHENNPSYCRKYTKYVGRKETCMSHKV